MSAGVVPPSGQRLRIVVVQGGPSSEAEVSRTSAKAVAAALKAAGHEAVRMELDGFLAESIRGGGYDVVFPAVHGAVGEDGSLQGLLEVLDVPYVGSGVLASALAMDKPTARRLFAAEGLPVARGIVVPPGDVAAAVRRARSEIGARFVVKPSAAGSALGVARLGEDASQSEAEAAFVAAWAAGGAALVEHFARGREVTCGVLDASALPGPDGDGPWAFSPTEIEAPGDAFYTFQARYAKGGSVHTCPARLSDALTARVRAVALAAHRTLGCRDLSRVDFVVGDDGDPSAITLLEVNTLPGFTGTSLFPEAAEVAGLSFATLCDGLVRSARARGTAFRAAAMPMP